jgi:diguanylate cyclase (GGDEF)-like protein
MTAKAMAARRLITGVAWREWVTVLIGAAVIAAMVLVAETARRDAEHHLRAEVLLERVRAEGEAIGSLNWQGLAMSTAGGTPRNAAPAQLVGGGLAAWRSLSADLTELSAIDPGGAATRLHSDAGGLYAAGMQAFMASKGADVKRSLEVDTTILRPRLAAFDAHATQAAANQQKVAEGASRRAAVLYVGSLVVGLLLLALLGLRLYRIRRRVALTDARLALEDELRHQAFHDSLTGLPNRRLFEDRLVHALARARRRSEPAAILFLDIDDFKTINDSLGHEAGDELLRAVAIRIAEAVRTSDTAARLGGDEFAVIAETLADEGEARTIAARLLHAVARPFELGGRELRVSASVGLAWSDGSTGVKELMRDADTAMYAAKDSGKNTVRVFEDGMHRRVLDRLELNSELQHAIEQEQFELDYQPVVNLQTGEIYGVEALVRWAHPQRGRVAPLEFIPLAEETGLIVPIGRWILEEATIRAAAWNVTGHRVGMSVTVSDSQLNRDGFVTDVRRALQQSGIDPSLLTLQIDESSVMRDIAAASDRLTEIKQLGVRIAIDDFGSGYAYHSDLQRLPLDFLTVDRSSLAASEDENYRRWLLEAIVVVGRDLSLAVIAKGVDSEEQMTTLRSLGCTLAQGPFLGAPTAVEAVEGLLDAELPATPPAVASPAPSMAPAPAAAPAPSPAPATAVAAPAPATPAAAMTPSPASASAAPPAPPASAPAPPAPAGPAAPAAPAAPAGPRNPLP